MNRRPRIPRTLLPEPEQRFRRATIISAAIHIILLGALIWPADGTVDQGPRAGDPGPRGGGGGGGGPEIRYIALQSAPAAPERVDLPIVREVPREIPLPTPTVRDIKPTVTVNAELRRPETRLLARRIGAGPGSGGGAGAGTGTGGGTGSGEGTGTGSGKGPGTGGDGGDVFPPSVRYTYLPPLPHPSELQGKTFHVRFFVDENGRVTRVVVDPQIGDADYRKKFLDVMRRFRFKPASLTDGTAVRGETVLSFTL